MKDVLRGTMMIPFLENTDLEALRSFLGIETVQGIGVLFNLQCSQQNQNFLKCWQKDFLKITLI